MKTWNYFKKIKAPVPEFPLSFQSWYLQPVWRHVLNYLFLFGKPGVCVWGSKVFNPRGTNDASFSVGSGTEVLPLLVVVLKYSRCGLWYWSADCSSIPRRSRRQPPHKTTNMVKGTTRTKHSHAIAVMERICNNKYLTFFSPFWYAKSIWHFMYARPVERRPT